MSILKAAHRESACSEVDVHAGIDATEEQVVRIDTRNRTAPIVAIVTDSVERTSADVAVARHGQFKR